MVDNKSKHVIDYFVAGPEREADMTMSNASTKTKCIDIDDIFSDLDYHSLQHQPEMCSSER